MANLILPESSYYIAATRAGRDPLVELGTKADEYEIATCGMVQLEVLRGRSDPHVLRRFRDAFAVMLHVPTTNAVWERAVRLAWSLDRTGVVLPAPDIIIAACALQVGAALLTHDAHFRQVPGLEVMTRI